MNYLLSVLMLLLSLIASTGNANTNISPPKRPLNYRTYLDRAAKEIVTLAKEMQTLQKFPPQDLYQANLRKEMIRQDVTRKLLEVHVLTSPEYFSGTDTQQNLKFAAKVFWYSALPVGTLVFSSYLRVKYGQIPWFEPAAHIPGYSNIVAMGTLSKFAWVATAFHSFLLTVWPEYRRLGAKPENKYSYRGPSPQEMKSDEMRSHFVTSLTEEIRAVGGIGASASVYARLTKQIAEVVGGEDQSFLQQGRWANAVVSEEQAREELTKISRAIAQIMAKAQNTAGQNDAYGRGSVEEVNKREIARLMIDADSLMLQSVIMQSRTQKIVDSIGRRLGIREDVRNRLRASFFEQLADATMRNEPELRSYIDKCRSALEPIQP